MKLQSLAADGSDDNIVGGRTNEEIGVVFVQDAAKLNPTPDPRSQPRNTDGKLNFEKPIPGKVDLRSWKSVRFGGMSRCKARLMK